VTAIREAELFARMRCLLGSDWVPIPDKPGYGGSGAAGKLLEERLGVDGGNLDLPDAGRWELKFHSGSALVTLFHLEAEPKGHLHEIVRTFGWPDKRGRTSFRHTIHGQSDRGFRVSDENGRITLRHKDHPDIVWAHWTHDKIMNAFSGKLRRLIAVKGRRKTVGGIKHVRYDSACRYWEPTISGIAEAVDRGTIAVDFDARTQERGNGLRNHGTKFRVKAEDLHSLYTHCEEFVH